MNEQSLFSKRPPSETNLPAMTSEEEEALAEHADRTTREFLEGVANELEPHIAAIVDATDRLLLAPETELTDPQKDDVRGIAFSCRLLRGLVRDIVDFNALSSGNLQLRPTQIDTARLLREVQHLVAGHRGKKPVQVVVDEDSAPNAVVWADEQRLVQILTNLAANALKFTDVGTVALKAELAEDDRVVLSVVDSGRGMSRADLERVFVEYEQAGEFRLTQRGTGLGLTIARRLVEISGGTLRAESLLEHGTAMYVSLPTTRQPVVSMRPAPTTEHGRKRAARDRIREAERFRSHFLASMTHDLRSPLMSILGYAELLTRSISAPDARGNRIPVERREVVGDRLRVIQEHGNMLLLLLSDVLDTARYEAGRLNLVRAWTPVVELITLAEARARATLITRPVTVRTELQPGLPPLHVDGEQIARALSSLLVHATRGLEHGELDFVARSVGGKFIQCAVEDRSHVIPEERRSQILTAAHRLDTTGYRQGVIGIALAIVRAAVRAHAGSFAVFIGPNGVLSFTLELPIKP